MDQKVNQIYTNCKNCTFAKYNGITQTGCTLDLLKKYKKLGVEIIEAYDDDKEFYILNKIRCRSARSHEWADKHEEQNLVKILSEENAIKYSVIVIPNSENPKVEEYETTVSSLLKQRLKPKKIINVIKNCQAEDRKEFDEIFKRQESSGVSWRNEFFLENFENDRCVDYVCKNINNTAEFFFVIMAGRSLEDDRQFERISFEINNNLLEFLIIDDEQNQNGYLIPKSAFFIFNGNKGKNIRNKILQIIEEEECQDLAKTWSDLKK